MEVEAKDDATKHELKDNKDVKDKPKDVTKDGKEEPKDDEKLKKDGKEYMGVDEFVVFLFFIGCLYILRSEKTECCPYINKYILFFLQLLQINFF